MAQGYPWRGSPLDPPPTPPEQVARVDEDDTLEEAPEAARLPELQLAPLSGPDPRRGQRQTINE
jgi:hypothetical protein